MAHSKVSRLFDRVDRLEFRFCRRINRTTRRPVIRGYFRVVSRLGDGWFWYALILSLPLMAGAQGLVLALTMVASGLVCTLLYKGLKHGLVRERPFISFPTIQCATPPLDRYSFPSGHTLHAVCFNTLVLLSLPTLGLALLPFTFSVMASRVVLGLHYPSDVGAGALIGVTLALLAHCFGEPLLAGWLLEQ